MLGTSKIIRQLIRECSSLTKQIVNYLIGKDIEVKTHDTLFIFQNSYCFSIQSVRHRITSQKQYSYIITNVLLSLKDWLLDALFQNPNKEIETEIEKILVGLNDGFMTNWIFEIISVHEFIKDYPLEDKLNAYHDKFLNDIYLHFYDDDEDLNEMQEDFIEFVYGIALQSLNILAQKNLNFKN